jgi:hypothetical protein
MVGSSFGDITPRTFDEIVVSIVIFLVGASALAKVFADFADLIYLLSIEKTRQRNKMEQALKFCKINNIKKDILEKIYNFYTMNDELSNQGIFPIKSFNISEKLQHYRNSSELSQD